MLNMGILLDQAFSATAILVEAACQAQHFQGVIETLVTPRGSSLAQNVLLEIVVWCVCPTLT
jgi:hypothetical protein